jgi:hypothetical protein
VADPVIVESDAPNRVLRQVRLSVLQAYYRPAFVEGNPTPMRVRLRQTYYYGENPTPAAGKKQSSPANDTEAGASDGQTDANENGTPAEEATSTPDSAGSTAEGNAGSAEENATSEPAEETPADATAPAAEPLPETP